LLFSVLYGTLAKRKKQKVPNEIPEKNKKNIGARRFISDTVHPRWIC
jgi:hypothetical protein